jgi:hypothetical protein
VPFNEVLFSVCHVVRFFVIAFCSLETIIRDTPGGYPSFSSVLGNPWWEPGTGYDYEGGTTVGMLRVMSRRGDDRVTWDKQSVLEGDPEATAAVREAERIFAQERAKGATAFRIDPGKPAQRIEEFDQTAEQIVLVPRVVGG